MRGSSVLDACHPRDALLSPASCILSPAIRNEPPTIVGGRGSVKVRERAKESGNRTMATVSKRAGSFVSRWLEVRVQGETSMGASEMAVAEDGLYVALD